MGKRDWSRLGFVILGVVLVAMGYRYRSLWAMFGEQERVRQWVEGFGAWGPLVSIALNVAQVVLAPIPGQVIGLVNGYLYGLWAGLAYSLAGVSLGSALAMGLARRFGRPLVERLVPPEQLARWDRRAAGQGALFFLAVFLLPFLPDDVACFLIGLSPLPLLRMFLLATAARLPGQFVACWMGAYATRIPLWAWAASLGLAAAVGWAATRAVER